MSFTHQHSSNISLFQCDISADSYTYRYPFTTFSDKMNDVYPGLVLEGYEFIEAIGMGGYSSVYRVRSQKFGRFYVAKVAHIRNSNMESAWQAFDSEIQALLRLDHPNIIGLFAHFRHGNNFILILEYCQKGSLLDYMRENGPINGVLLLRTVKQICSALKCAWEQGVYHRDIKPANILLDEKGNAKLVDFGISKIIQNDGVAVKDVDFRCSPICAAPELVNEVPHDPIKSDIWSLGITLLWLAGGTIPWNYKHFEELLQAIREGSYIVPEGMDPGMVIMVKAMLKMEPDKRRVPTEDEINALVGGRIAVSPSSAGMKLDMDRERDKTHGQLLCHAMRRPGMNGSSSKFLSSPVQPVGRGLQRRTTLSVTHSVLQPQCVSVIPSALNVAATTWKSTPPGEIAKPEAKMDAGEINPLQLAQMGVCTLMGQESDRKQPETASVPAKVTLEQARGKIMVPNMMKGKVQGQMFRGRCATIGAGSHQPMKPLDGLSTNL